MSAPARTTRGSLGLSLGTVVGGIAAYLFIVVGTRLVGADDFAPVGLVWTAWTVAAAALTYPVQHLVMVRRASGRTFRSIELLPAVLAAAGVIAAGLAVTRTQVLGTSSFGPVVAIGLVVVGAYWMGVSRGRLAANGRFTMLGVSLAGEGSGRFLVLVPVALLGAATTRTVLVALLTGFLVLLLPTGGSGAGPANGSLTTRTDAGAVLAFGIGNAAAMLVLSGGVLLMPSLGAPAATTTALFATAALLRAPYLLLIGVSPRISDALLRLAPGDRPDPRAVLGTILAAAAVAGAVAVAVGPPLVGLVFGEAAVLDGGVTGVLAAAHVLALATLALALVPVSVDKPRAVTRAWAPATATWAATALLLPTSPVVAVAWATLLAEVVVFAVLGVELRRWVNAGVSPPREVSGAG